MYCNFELLYITLTFKKEKKKRKREDKKKARRSEGQKD
jgi:hypothetical protein